MYEQIVEGFIKMQDDYHRLKSPGSYYSYKGQPLAVFYPNMDKVIPTLFFIAAISLFDESLELYINYNFMGTKFHSLEERITFLGKNGKLIDVQTLHQCRKERNKYSHEYGKYASWADAENLFLVISKEFKNLGIMT